MTDYQIADIARLVTKEDEERAKHVFDVLGQLYRPVGKYGLCVMLYSVAYTQGAQSERDRRQDDVIQRIKEKSAAEEFMFNAACV